MNEKSVIPEPLTSEEKMLNLMWANLEACDGNHVDLAMAIDMLLEQSGGEETDMVRMFQWILRNDKWPAKENWGWFWFWPVTDVEEKRREALPRKFFRKQEIDPYFPYRYRMVYGGSSIHFSVVMHFLYERLQETEFKDLS